MEGTVKKVGIIEQVLLLKQVRREEPEYCSPFTVQSVKASFPISIRIPAHTSNQSLHAISVYAARVYFQKMIILPLF